MQINFKVRYCSKKVLKISVTAVVFIDLIWVKFFASLNEVIRAHF